MGIRFNNQKGYTLIEMMVAVSIFVILIAAPTGFFTVSLRSQQKALYTQEMLDNTSFILEYMSRAIRMAKKDVDGDCITPNNNFELTQNGKGIKFKNYHNECQEFYLDDTTGKLTEVKGGTTQALNPQNLKVNTFKIGPADSWDQGDDLQPRVTIYFDIQNAKSGDSANQPRIKVQTTVSQRNLDLN